VLITNAERGWIELSCQKFMPSLLPCLESIKVLSARTTYEKPGLTPVDWKHHAFENEIARIFGPEDIFEPKRRKNIVSLGDSIHEREALHRATAQLPNCRSKSVKFLDKPALWQVTRQQVFVSAHLHDIVQHDGHLDIHIRL